MAQITIYLPDDVAEEVRRKAREARLSLSAYMTQIARRSVRRSLWPDEFRALYGSCSLEVPEDMPPEDTPAL